MAKTWDGPPLLKAPAAQTLLAELAATLRRVLLLPGSVISGSRAAPGPAHPGSPLGGFPAGLAPPGG
jgi:hypothetical protein